MRNELLLAALGLTTLASSCTDKKGSESGDSGPQGPQTCAAPARAKTPDLGKLLKAVSEKPEPEELSMGAMCYDMAMPPERVEYVCPTCGNKTLHVLRKDGEAFAGWRSPVLNIAAYRKHIRHLNTRGLDITLDETCLCSTCKKEVANALAVEVTYQGKRARSDLRDIDDLRKLLALIEGRLVWKGEQDAEHPLKPALPRIRELLGLAP